MNILVSFGKSWHRMSITDRGIWIFFAASTLAILTLLKLLILGK